MRTWCTLLVDNLFAFVRDTYKGLSRPKARRHVAPYPSFDTDSLGAHVPSRAFSVNVVGTFATPVVVAGIAGGSIVTKETSSKDNAEDIERRDGFNLYENSEEELGKVMIE